MEARYCETTFDIALTLTPIEALELRRTDHSTPILEAAEHGLVFSLMNVQEGRPYIVVKEPRDPDVYPRYGVSINPDAYQDLIGNKFCGTRYGNSSKVSIYISEED